MSLDELIRGELHRSVEAERLDDDSALDRVRLTHRRGLVRSRIARQATAVLVVVSLFAGVAVFLSWGAQPENFRSTATLRLAVPPSHAPTSTSDPSLTKLPDPRTLALAPSTLRAALDAAHLPPDDTRIAFHARLNATRDVLTLSATAPSVADSDMVVRAWASVFANLRREAARHRVSVEVAAINRRVDRLHHELENVDRELAKIDPAHFQGVLGYDSPISPPLGTRARPPTPQKSASVRELNLAYERIQLIAALADSGQKAATLRIESVQPSVFATTIAQAPASRVHQTPPAAVPALVSWLIAFVLVLGGALVLYRVRVRRLRQDSAYSR